ncbi:MAG: YceI family protein, partial [Candidatus Dormibacteria bacterium]
GELTIRGQTRPVRLRAAVDHSGRLQGSATLVQSEFGIRPYTAFLGALRLADQVQVRFQLQLPTH